MLGFLRGTCRGNYWEDPFGGSPLTRGELRRGQLGAFWGNYGGALGGLFRGSSRSSSGEFHGRNRPFRSTGSCCPLQSNGASRQRLVGFWPLGFSGGFPGTYWELTGDLLGNPLGDFLGVCWELAGGPSVGLLEVPLLRALQGRLRRGLQGAF